jgi:phage minor structural protein
LIHILNRFDEIIGFLSNENPETPVYWGGKHTEKLNSAANYYEFSTVTDHEYVKELTNMNKVVARHPDGYFIPFRIHRVTQRNKDGIREKVVEVEGEHMRLRTAKVLSPITLTSATLKTAAHFILSGTGWQVGRIEFAGAKTVEFKDFTNALKALHHINELFGMEIRFRIEIQRNRVVGRYVDFLERVGEDNGKEIVLGKDLISVERMEDSNEVYTALIGIGKANEEGKSITFEGINGGKNYVEDQEAFQRWGDESGHHIGVYYVEPEEGEELTPEIVRERTKEALKRHIESVVQYKVTGASLEKVFDLNHEKVRKGDTVRIKDTGFTPPLYLEARVLEIFRYDDPGKEDEFLLGNYKELKIKPNQILLEIQKQLFRNERKWSSAVRKVRSTLPPQDQTVIWIDTTEVPNIVRTYNESESAWEKASPTVAAEVGAETPEGAEAKANTAKSEAIAYMNTQLTNYVNATLYSDDISELQAQIDNQIQSHFKPYEPSLSNEPASDWHTDEERRNHVGDLFYNTETGHSYRFALDGTIFTWLMVRDEGIAKALADAAQAQDTADSKRRTFISQPNTPYDEGDLWDKDGAVFRSTVTKTKSASFSLSDWVKIGDVTSENKAKDTDAVGGVPAEDIETKEGASGKATQAKADAQTFTETYANKKVTQSTLPPESPSHDDLWIDISGNPYVWKRWDGETWKKATPTTADEVGAETPNGAQYKANQAKEDAVSIAQQDAAKKAASAVSVSRTFTEEFANKKISQGTSAPSAASADDLWIDTSQTPYVWKRYTGSSWVKATPTTASEVGAETPDGAQAKANAARDAAISSAAGDAESKAAAAESAAKTYAKAQANAAQTAAQTHADGKVTAEEEARIQQAQANLADAKKHADDAAEAAKSAAKNYADTVAESAGSSSKAFTQEYAQKQVTQQSAAPSNPETNDLWIDTSKNPHIWKKWNGSYWIKLTPTTAAEVGAETPSGAEAKANAAKANAESAAKSYTDEYAEKKVTKSSTAPSKPSNGDMWIDSSENVWKRWNGSSWVKLTRTALPELTGKISAGQISANIITSDHIATVGLDAGVIKTGVLDAVRVRIGSGSVFESGFDPTKQDALVIPDTRDKNQLPTWYRENYGKKIVSEFKSRKAVNAPGSTTYGTLTTRAGWKDSSGGSVTQEFSSYDGVYYRRSISDDTEWSDWENSETASGALAKANAAESAAKTYASNRFDGTKNLVSGWKYGSTTYIDGGNIYANSLTANAIASKTLTANELKSGIIDSDLIVTSGLDAGVIKFGTMSGSRIQVGTLDADRIGAGVIDARRIAIGSGTSFASGFDPSTKETPGGAQAKANAAESSAVSTAANDASSKANAAKSSAISTAASDATSKANAAESAAKKHADDTYSGTKSLVDGWKYGSTTYINGGDIYTNTITANQIATKTITANQLKAGIIDSDLIVTAGLDAGVIKFGTMSGKRIAAKSITTDELNVLARNLVNNFSVTGDLAGWSSSSSKGASSSVSVYGGSIVKDVERGNVLKIVRSSKTYYYSEWFEVDPTQDYKVSLGVKVPNNIERVYFGIETYDEDGNQVGTQTYNGNTWTTEYNSNAYFWNSGDQQDLSEWRDMYGHVMGMNADPEDTPEGKNVSSQFRFHPKTKYLQIRFLHYMNGSESFWYSPSVVAVSGGKITTNQITAGGLNANVITFGTMHGDRIDVRTLNGNRIETNTIDSNHIVTGGLNANVIKFGSMDGERIATNSLHANRIQSQTIDSDLIVTAGLDAGVIKFGTMHGNRIISNSLHGDKITAGTLNADRLEANSIIADDIKFTGKLDGATGNFAGELTAYTLKVDTQMGGEILIGTGSFGSGGAVWNDGGDVRIGNDSLNGTGRAINIESSSGDVEVDVRGTLHAKHINFVESISADEVYGTEVHGTNIYGTTYHGNNVITDKVTTTVVELASGDANIVLSDDNPNFRGYNMGAVIQFNGDGRADGALIKAAGIQATSVLDLGTGRMYGDNGTLFRFGDDGSSYQHHTFKFGNAMLKSLNSSMSSIQARNLTDSDYIQLAASDFRVGSLRAYKKNIEPYTGEALQKVLSTQVYHYHLNSDDDRELKRVGLIYEESDADVIDPAGDGMSSYSMSAVLWKALQDLNQKVVDLENKIA